MMRLGWRSLGAWCDDDDDDLKKGKTRGSGFSDGRGD